MKKWIACSMAVLIATMIIHLFIVLSFPWMVMRLAHRKIAERAGGVNVVVHNPPTTAANNPIVNSSPDLLYSACAYDLSSGPLRLRATVPATYWSVSGFDSETNNFFSVNNMEEHTGGLDLVLVGPGVPAPAAGSARIVRSPSRRGVILFRTLVPTADRLEEMKRVQKKAACLPL